MSVVVNDDDGDGDVFNGEAEMTMVCVLVPMSGFQCFWSSRGIEGVRREAETALRRPSVSAPMTATATETLITQRRGGDHGGDCCMGRKVPVVFNDDDDDDDGIVL